MTVEAVETVIEPAILRVSGQTVAFLGDVTDVDPPGSENEFDFVSSLFVEAVGDLTLGGNVTAVEIDLSAGAGETDDGSLLLESVLDLPAQDPAQIHRADYDAHYQGLILKSILDRGLSRR